MNLPDSRWIAILREVEWWLLAAVTTVAAVTFLYVVSLVKQMFDGS